MITLWLFAVGDKWECEGEFQRISFEALPPFAQERIAVLKVAATGRYIQSVGSRLRASMQHGGRALFEIEATLDEIHEIRRAFR